MKSTVLRYGLYASLVVVGLGLINCLVLIKNADYTTQEIAGYLTITLAMIFIFFGIRHYRDHVNGGSLRFGEGLKIGFLIALVPAICFGLFNLLYVEVIDPGWQDEYYGHYLQQVRESTPPAELQAKLDKLQQQREFFSNPVITFLFMSLTVFVVGAIVTIISALWLRRNKPAIA